MARPQRLRSVGSVFKTILIGYDEPERGGEATALAEVLCDPRAGTLLLASAYPTAPLTADGLDETNQMLAEARDGLRKPASVQIRALASDWPGRALKETAEAEHADLVVVGSGRRSALGQPLPGTAAERLIADPPCPVAVAPRGYSRRDIRRIGVAYDGSPASVGALRVAESLALEVGASLTVYGVADSAPLGLRPETQILDAVPAEEIAGRAYGVVDLLFIGACDDGQLHRALLDNVSGAFVRAAGCPVVVTPRNGRLRRQSPNAAVAART